MNRSCVWLCTLTAATAATISEARAFTLHEPATAGLAHFVAGPEPRGPGSAPAGIIKPPAPPSGNYSFSGNSFNLSVTKNGKPVAPPPPPVASPSGERPGLIRRMLDWAFGD